MGKRAPTFEELKGEYTALLADATVSPNWSAEANRVAKYIIDALPTLKEVEARTGVPAWVVGTIQAMEAGCGPHGLRLDCHLHNGDSLQHQTHNVPAGRPPNRSGPFTFVESAIDAIQYDGLDKVDWSTDAIERVLFRLEAYNGWGPRLFHNSNTAYLWSGTNQYKRGKYVSDGVWSENAVSGQIGAVPIVLALKALGVVNEPVPVTDDGPGVTVDSNGVIPRWPSAEQPREEVSPTEVVKEGSRSMGMLQWIKAKYAALIAGFGGYESLKFVSDGKDAANDICTIIEKHSHAIVGLVLVAGLVMACLGAWYLVEARRDGRYDPHKA